METLGWIGSVLLGICGVPQMLQSIREKHSNGLNWGFLLCWFFGEICVFFYVLPKADWPLIANYFANVVLLLVIIYYKLFPGDRKIIKLLR